MNINNTQATYAPIYPSSIISHDTEEYKPVYEDISEDTEAKGAKSEKKYTVKEDDVKFLINAGFNVKAGDELTEEQEAALLKRSGSLLDGVFNTKEEVDIEGGMPLSSSQNVINRVYNMILNNELTVNGEQITAEMLLDSEKVNRVNSAIMQKLEEVRMDELKPLIDYISFSKGISLNKAETEALKRIAPFKDIPAAIIEALLIATGTIKAVATTKTARDIDKMLVYREYNSDGKPTVYRLIQKRADEDSAVTLGEIFNIINALNSGLNESEYRKITAGLIKSAPLLIKPTDEAVIRKCVFAANGIADVSRSKWNAAAGRNLTPDGKPFDFYEYGTEEAERLVNEIIPTTYNTVRNLKCVLDLPPVIKYNNEDKTQWEVISGIHEVVDDPLKELLILQTMQGGVRGTSYGEGWLYQDVSEGTGGGSGKSTIAGLARELLGADNVLPVSLDEMGQDPFTLETLPRYAAIICGENEGKNGEKYNYKLFKQICRQDEGISLNRKHKARKNIDWHGMVIECTNNKSLNLKDDSDSAYRALEVIQFGKSFGETESRTERKYIKGSYIKDGDVLDYLLWYVLVCIPFSPNGYDKEALNHIKEAKDALRTNSRSGLQFLEETLSDYTVINEDGTESVIHGLNLSRITVNLVFPMYQQWGNVDAGLSNRTAIRDSFIDDMKRYANGRGKGKYVFVDKPTRLIKAEASGHIDEVAKYRKKLYEAGMMDDISYSKGLLSGNAWNADKKGGLWTVEEYIRVYGVDEYRKNYGPLPVK